MPQPSHLDPSAFRADGGPLGILLIHGFTGSVAETRPMGEYLAAHGFTVRCPLLPGHGTTAYDLTHIRWRAWTGEVETALRDLQSRCQAVFVGGLSLGSLLSMWLGARHPEIAGLILMAPAVKVTEKLMPLALVLRPFLKFNPRGGMSSSDLGDPTALERLWGYDETPLCGAAEVYLLQRQVRRLLAHIRQPVLIFQGRRDIYCDPQAGPLVYDSVASTDRELIWLENSGHNVLADCERERLWATSYEWMLARSTAGANASTARA